MIEKLYVRLNANTVSVYKWRFQKAENNMNTKPLIIYAERMNNMGYVFWTHFLSTPEHGLSQWEKMLHMCNVIPSFTATLPSHRSNTDPGQRSLYSCLASSCAYSDWWMTSPQDKRPYNTWRLKQNYRHFTHDIFKCIFVNGNVSISLKISLKIVRKVSINNIPALVQLMVWRRLVRTTTMGNGSSEYKIKLKAPDEVVNY